MIQPILRTDHLGLDLTGVQVTPSVGRGRTGAAGGHGGLTVEHQHADLELALSVLGARLGIPESRPGHLGRVQVRLSIPALQALRDACDEALTDVLQEA